MGGATKYKTLTAASTWVWLGVYFFAVIPLAPFQRISLGARVVGIVVLGAITVTALALGVQRRAANRALTWAYVLAFVSVIHLAIQPSLGVGTWTGYLAAGAGFVLTYGLTIVFAGWFFERDRFLRTFMRIANVALGLSIVAYGSSQILGTQALVSTRIDTGVSRLQGTLPEPSAWGPVLAAMFLVGLHSRRRRYLVWPLVGVILTQSPTTYLVAVVSVGTYVLVTTSWRSKRPLAVLSVVALGSGAAWFVGTADSDAWLGSDRAISRTVGRTLSGINNVTSGGEVGRNDRYVSTSLTFEQIDELGIGLIGAGPDAHAVFFAEKYPGADQGLRGPSPNAIWVMAAFTHGWLGMVALLTAMAVTLLRLGRDREMAGLLLPFMVASLINSAGGYALYQFVVLAVFLYGAGWASPQIRPRSDPLRGHSPGVVKARAPVVAQ